VIDGVRRPAAVLGDQTTLQTIAAIMDGTHRFEELTECVQASPSVLAARLKLLVGQGVLTKRPYREHGQRRRDEYVLTPDGEELRPILISLVRWGTRRA